MQAFRSFFGHTIFVAGLILCGALAALPAFGSEGFLESRIIHTTEEEIYVNAGFEAGLKTRDVGSVRRDGAEICRVKVVEVSRTTARIQIVGKSPLRLLVGDLVVFTSVKHLDAPVETPAEPVPVPETQAPPSEVTRAASTRKSNVFHAKLRARYLVQDDLGSNTRDYFMTRVGSDGNVDRIRGSLWALAWSGNVSNRGGAAYSQSAYYSAPRFDVYRAMLQRKFEGGGFFKLGRFLPNELPSLGYVDGAQLDRSSEGAVRLGNVAGLKPSRERMDLSDKEPLDCAYGTFEAGERGSLYYSGTLGALGTLFKKKLDRTAILHEQQVDLGPKFNLFSSLEADFNLGQSTKTLNDYRLSRLSVFGTMPLSPLLTLRGGLDHFETLDTQAEREFLGTDDPSFFDNTDWRYWGGASQTYYKIRMDEEVSFLKSEGENLRPRWRASFTRLDLFTPNARMTVTGYNLYQFQGQGFGGVASLYLPLFKDTVSLYLSSEGRWNQADGGIEKMKMVDHSAHMDMQVQQRLSLYAGVSHSPEFEGSNLYDMGADLRW